MRVLVTGAGGVVGSAVVQAATDAGHEVIAWDRSRVPPHDPARIRGYVEQVAPDAVVHAAIASAVTGVPDEGRLVNRDWPRILAEACGRRDAAFVYTSTVMVFTDRAPGPYTPGSPADADEGYGLEKRSCEADVLAANPRAVIARLGWQIGGREGNSMLAHLDRQMREQGRVAASARWFPATSFVQDTAAALIELIRRPGGVYLLDGNVRWSFLEIVRALDAGLGLGWNVVQDDGYAHDQRMQDGRVAVAPLDRRLHLPRI